MNNKYQEIVLAYTICFVLFQVAEIKYLRGLVENCQMCRGNV